MEQAVLVTGGAGFVGSHTCKSLSAAGFRPVTVDNLGSGHRAAVKWGPLEVCDVGDRAGLRSVFERYDIAAVVHFAAHAYVGESVLLPHKYFENNCTNTLALLEAMRDAGVDCLVFASSCATFGTPRTCPITEEAPQQPLNPYGESKLFIEKVLGWYAAAYGLRWASLRYFNAAGADPDGEIGEDHDPETHLVPLAIQAALGRRAELAVFGSDYPTADGTAVRDYVHVTDLADAHVLALERLLAGGSSQAFNLGAGRGYSVLEVVRAVEVVAQRPVPLRFAAPRPGDPAELFADPRKAEDVLGWKRRYSDLATVVETAWLWQAQGGRTWNAPAGRRAAMSAAPAPAPVSVANRFRGPAKMSGETRSRGGAAQKLGDGPADRR